jgi:spermidine/putrescine transport system substrate-binding protein
MAKALGFDPPNMLTADQLEQVVEEMKKIRANARVVAPSLGDLGDVLARGDAWITTQSWEGVATFVRDKGEEAEWTVPKEGSWGWNDHYCIPKEAPNAEGAYAFINTMISPEANASICTTFVSGTPVEGAVPLMEEPAKSLFDYSDVGKTLAELGFYALPPFEPEGGIMTMDDWNAAWEEIKG